MYRILVVTIVIPMLCFCQNTKRFVVIDSVSNLPIPYVAIKLSDIMGFYTDEYGEFNTDLIPKTLKSIRVGSLGYEAKDVLIGTGKTIDSIVLVPKNEILETVYINLKLIKPNI